MVSNCAEASGPDEKPVTVTHEKSNSPLHTHTHTRSRKLHTVLVRVFVNQVGWM